MELRRSLFILLFCLVLPSLGLAQRQGQISLLDHVDERESSENQEGEQNADTLTIFQKGEQKVLYDRRDDRYHYYSENQHISTPRYHRQDFKDKIRRLIEDEEWDRLSSRIDEHYTWQRAATPSPEENLSEAFAARDLAMGILQNAQSFPCGGKPGPQGSLRGPSRFQLQVSDEAAGEIEDVARAKFIEERSYMPLGELTGMSVEFTSQNDNPLFGGLSAAGVTEHSDGIEGDDRGKTMGLGVSTAFLFDEGSITIRKTTEGYGRLAPQTREETHQPPKTSAPLKGQPVKIGNQSYTTEVREHRDEDGKYYQEFLSVDGLELEVRRDLGDEVYVRVVGKREEFDDKGLAGEIQEEWHENLSEYSDGSVEYNYLDHRDRDVRYSAKFEVGKEITLQETNNYVLSSDVSGSVQASNRDSGREVGFRGELRLATADGQGEDNTYPSWEARVYMDGRMNRNREETIHTGAELRRRFSLSEKNDKFISISGGMSYEDDPLSRKYASEEVQDNGGYMDLQHTLHIQFEQGF